MKVTYIQNISANIAFKLWAYLNVLVCTLSGPHIILSSLSKNAAFLVGSIEEVNRKISNLDRKLQSYTDLVVESRSSDQSDAPFQIQLSVPNPAREVYHQRGESKLAILCTSV